jgi:L-iditol 2-dehydrogenase
MKALRKFTRNGSPVFELADIPVPVLSKPTDIKIKISSIGICTSDVHVLHGVMSVPEGNIIGHEYSGEVVEVGEGVTDFKPGDRVVGELAVGACGECRMCHRGKYEFCRYKRPPGWVSPGVYTEYTVMDQRLLHHIPNHVNFDVAALAEAVAICIYGSIERGQISQDDFTVIYGMGSIGLITLIVLLDYGLDKIVCVTPTKRDRGRFEMADELGAYRVLSTDEKIEAIISNETDGDMPDCVIDCSGSPDAINEGMKLLRKDGLFIGLGITSQNMIPFEFNMGIHKALKIVFSSTSSHTSWKRAVRLLDHQRDRLQKLITHRYPLSEWRTAFEKLDRREAIKVVLYNP